MTARRWLHPLLMALPLAALTGCASSTPAPERYTLPVVAVSYTHLTLPTKRIV